VRKMDLTYPPCPRPGHSAGTVSRDGVQDRGGRRRQRWRCTLSNGDFHRFMGAVSRTHLERQEATVCVTCDSQIGQHQGPAAMVSSQVRLSRRRRPALL